MKKAYRWIILSLAALIICAFSVSAKAGQYGDFTYTDDGTYVTITDYTGSGGSVIIPDTIIGKQVAKIGDSAFSGCTKLTSVIIPYGVTSVGFNAFFNCSGLTRVTIPASVNNFGGYVFANCSGLTRVTIPAGLGGIAYGLFYRCTKLTSITIPDSVTRIEDDAFFNCTSLTSVTIPNSVTSIGAGAFFGCAKLVNIAIPASVTSIGDYAFTDCTGLASTTVDELNSSYSSVDGVLFNKAQSTLIQYPCGKSGNYTIPDSVTSIGIDAFSKCINLTGITIPDSVTSIGSMAFYRCNSLTSVTIPNSVIDIGLDAFSGCTGLTSITIGAGATSIGLYYYTCTALTSITVHAFNSSYSSVDGVLFNKSQTTLLQYPCSKSGVYYTIPDGITSIENYAFYNCTKLSSVTIPNSVTSIGGIAFRNCTRLTSVTIPNSVTSIGDAAFMDCTGMTSTIIGNSVTSIGNNAFTNCTMLTSITIPDSVTSIGNNAFTNCTRLTRAAFLGDEPSIMGTQVFDSCAPKFTVYYPEYSLDFTSPTWKGYPSAILSNDTLSVHSSGATSVPITSATGHGGITNYTASAVHGMTVSLTAPNIVGMHFTGWTGGVSSSLQTVIFPMPAGANITANYAINKYSIVFTADTNGSITGTKAQTVNHAANCTEVTAVADANYRFTGWTGYYTGVDNPLTLTNVTSDKVITANFAHDAATLTLSVNGNGTSGFSGVNPLNTVTATPILATAAANNHFVNWSVTTGSAIVANVKSAATTVTLMGDHGSSATITANFAEDAVPTVVPAIPVISATDGTYEDRVVITWKAVPTATSYEVYRNTTNTPDGSDLLGTVSDVIFEDNTAEFNNVYYYFVKAKNSIGPSNFSTGNSGYVAKAPSIPGAVTASDGTYFDKVRVSWSKVVGATSYLVFRMDSATPAPDPNLKTDLIGETTALFLDDFGDDLDITGKYYYWIAAKNDNVTTAISKPNIGYLSNKGPSKVTASNGTYSDRIVVTWTEVPGATSYDVWRYTDSKFSKDGTKVGDTVAALEYENNPVAAETPFYYKVNAKYAPGSYDSAPSLTGAAGKASGTSNPTATNINDGDTSANIVDKEKGSILYFSTEVPFGTTRLVATLDGTSKLITNDCNVFAKFANYPTVSSYNAKGVENITNEILTVSNPSAGIWYFMLYGVTSYTDVTLTVNCYAVADIVLSQIPVNDLPVPFKAAFKGKVVDESGTGIKNMIIQVRNPITGLTSNLAKTDKNGVFTYVTTISTEGEHTFDFFFTDIPDTAKGTASHTVATRKGCLIEEPNNFFDYSSYLPATPVPVPLQADITGLQNFLNTRNAWSDDAIVGTYETMWVDSTLVKAEDDAQLAAKLGEGLYMVFYGVEGAGVGNDTTTTPALSAVPFVVHVETSKKGDVITALNTLGVIDAPQKTAIGTGSIGIIAVASLSDPDEVALAPSPISLLACEQLELLANLAAGAGSSSDGGTYSGVSVRKVTVTLAGRKINVVAAGFVK